MLPGMRRDESKTTKTGWTGDRVIADLLNRGTYYGSMSGGWTQNRIELVRHIRHWVYVAIRARCQNIAKNVPNVSYRIERSSSAKGFMTKALRQKSLVRLADDEDLRPAPADHPLVRLLRNPNAMDTMWDLWYEAELFGSSTGNIYFWTPKSRGFNKPAAIFVLPSHWVWPISGSKDVIQGYEIRPADGAYKRLYFPADEVVHVKYKSPISKIDGQSPMDATSRWIDVSESIDTSRWHTMKQGTFGSVAIKLGPEFYDPTDEDIMRVEQKWLQRYQGERRHGKPIILPPGLEMQQLMLSAKEMDYTDSSNQLRDAIFAAFSVPKEVVGIFLGTQRNTAETALFQFAMQAINPALEMLGQSLTKFLAAQFDPDLVIWWDDTTPADRAQTNADIGVNVAAHSITVNEIREQRGLERWPDGDEPPAVYMLRKQVEIQGTPNMQNVGGEKEDPEGEPEAYRSQVGTESTPPLKTPKPPEMPLPKPAKESKQLVNGHSRIEPLLLERFVN